MGIGWWFGIQIGADYAQVITVLDDRTADAAPLKPSFIRGDSGTVFSDTTRLSLRQKRAGMASSTRR